MRRIALGAAWRLNRLGFPLLAADVLPLRRLLGISALPVVACAELLGDVAVGQAPAPGSAPTVEISTGAVIPLPLPVAPTPPGSETLPVVPILEAAGGSAPAMESPAPAPTPTCEDGDFRCTGADVEFCLNGQEWIPWQTCGSPRLCQSEPAGRCIPAPCATGQQRCVDGSLQRCSDDLTGFAEVELCATAAHCDPRQGQCLSAPCAPGQQRCNGDQLEACSDDQLSWVALEQCASVALCQSGDEESAVCLPPSCGEGDFRCGETGVLQVCNADLNGFNNVAQCATPALCNAELGRCEAPACNPGQNACSPLGELLICNEARSGFRSRQPAVICDETETCDALNGVCEPIPQPPPPPPPPDEPTVEDDDDDRPRPRDRDDDDDDDDDDRRRRDRDDDD